MHNNQAYIFAITIFLLLKYVILAPVKPTANAITTTTQQSSKLYINPSAQLNATFK